MQSLRVQTLAQTTSDTSDNLAYIFLNHPKLSYQDWRLLHEWLTPLPYIKPADRKLFDPLLILLINKYGFNTTKLKSYFIESHIDYQTQEELSQWISEFNN